MRRSLILVYTVCSSLSVRILTVNTVPYHLACTRRYNGNRRLTKSVQCPVQTLHNTINSFPASGDFCRLLITFPKNFDPDHSRQNVGPDLHPNSLSLWWYSWKNLFKQLFKKKKKKKKKKNPPKKTCKIAQYTKSKKESIPEKKYKWTRVYIQV